MQDITQSELILNLILSAGLFGVIWIVQIVQYPSFLRISEDQWQSFHRHHTNSISWIVMPLMLAEFTQTGMLLLRSGVTGDWFIPMLIILAIWLSTFFIQIPLHHKLEEGKDEQIIRRLILTNWIRTILWSVKLIFIAWLCYISLS